MNNEIKKQMMAAAVVLMVACTTPKETVKEDYGNPESADAAMEVTAADIIAQGESLVKASDCKTCHHVANKIIGPSHTDVAKKYEFTTTNVAYLAGRIINGGAGVWGEIPMTAHTDLSQADAEKMARYVLSLDGEIEH